MVEIIRYPNKETFILKRFWTDPAVDRAAADLLSSG